MDAKINKEKIPSVQRMVSSWGVEELEPEMGKDGGMDGGQVGITGPARALH